MTLRLVLLHLLLCTSAYCNWQQRFNTLIEALVYPLTRQLPVQNEEEPPPPVAKDPFSVCKENFDQLTLQKEDDARRYMQALKDCVQTGSQPLQVVHSEFRRLLIDNASPEVLLALVNDMPSELPEAPVIVMDVLRILKSQDIPWPDTSLTRSLMQGDDACQQSEFCLRAHGGYLMEQGQFAQAVAIFNKAYADPETEFEAMNARFMLQLEERKLVDARQTLQLIRQFHKEMELSALELELAYASGEWRVIAGFLQRGYQPEPHQYFASWVALMWQESFKEASAFAQARELNPDPQIQSFAATDQAIYRILLTQYLEPALMADTAKNVSLGPVQLAKLQTILPAESPLHRIVFPPEMQEDPMPTTAVILNSEQILLLYRQVSGMHREDAQRIAAFVEHLQFDLRENCELALSLIGNGLPDSLELKSRLSIRANLPLDDLVAGDDTSIDAIMGRALALAHQGKTTDAISTLQALPDKDRRGIWHLLNLDALIGAGSWPEAQDQAEDILERWPEFLSHPGVVTVLSYFGDFERITKIADDEVPALVWETYVHAHLFTGKFRKFRQLIGIRTLENLPVLPDVEDVSGHIFVSMLVYRELSAPAKLAQQERYREQVSPLVAKDLLQSQSYLDPEIIELLQIISNSPE